jgi:hypothetical protein
MGAERPTGVRPHPEGAEPSSTAGEASADVVDFDALHAALGELPPPATSSSPIVSESQGRKNATYASVRPHEIPSTRPPVDMDVPAVIIAPDDAPPPAPQQQQTVPLGMVYPHARAAPREEVARRTPRGAVPSPVQRQPTLILRDGGPTRTQKLLVFIAMLLVFIGGGIAFLIYGRHLDVR